MTLTYPNPTVHPVRTNTLQALAVYDTGEENGQTPEANIAVCPTGQITSGGRTHSNN